MKMASVFMRLLPLATLFLLLSGCSVFSSDKTDEDVVVIDTESRLSSKPETHLLESGMLAYNDGLYSIARDRWTELRDSYPASPYIPMAELKIADAFFASRDYEEARGAYDDFLRNFPGNEAAHYALFQSAASRLRQYKGSNREQVPVQEASKLLKKLLVEYPNSPFTSAAKEYLVLAQEEQARHELEIIRFYARQNQIEAGAARLAKVQRQFAGTKALANAGKDLFLDVDNIYELISLAKTININSDLGIEAPKTPLLVAAFADTGDYAHYLEETTQVPETAEPLFELRCEIINNTSAAVTVTAPMRISYDKIPSRDGKNMAVNLAVPDILKSRNQKNSLNCGGISATLNVTTENAQLLLLGVGDVDLLALDRPHRVVAIVNREMSQ